MTGRVQCRKCGADLDPKQKVCPRCGERTAAGFKFDVEEEVKWRPSRRAIVVTVAAVVIIVLALILYNVLHVVPPEVVAKQWFAEMSSRAISSAREHVTKGFEDGLATRMSNLQALSDEYNLDTFTNSATYRVGKPTYSDPSHVDISILLTYPGNSPGPEVKIQMVKMGRQWKIDQVL